MIVSPNRIALSPSAPKGNGSPATKAVESEAKAAGKLEPQESVSLSAKQQVSSKQTEATAPSAQTEAGEVKTVKVAVYAQDPFVAKPILMEIPQGDIGSKLSSDRVRITDNRPLAKPDADGNFILAEGSDGISQVNALVTTNGTLQLFEDYRGAEIEWASGRQIPVTPHKQEGRNAYYSRYGGMNYFYSESPGLGRVMKTANSTDVAAHETGHALLDGIRPGYFGTHDDETGAFHEGFGDCVAMLKGLTDASNRKQMLEQTGGDLRKQNLTASLAEEFGAARVLDNSDPSDDHRTFLRNALNGFTYTPPSEQPPGRGSDTELGREVHSFSRLFSGAFYDVIESVYNQAIKDGQSPDQALITSERVNGPLLTRSIESASTSRATYKQIALGMLASDKALNGGKYSDGIQKAFTDRKIITAQDVKADEARRAEIPALDLPADLSKANAVNFLEANSEALGLPADLPYVPERVATNGKGETFVSFRYAQEVPVTVAGLEGLVTDVHGGVNLVFGADGKLIDRNFTEITSDTVEREMKGIASFQESNSIVNAESLEIFKSNDADVSLFKSAIEGNKLVRIPISSCDHDHGDHAH